MKNKPIACKFSDSLFRRRIYFFVILSILGGMLTKWAHSADLQAKTKSSLPQEHRFIFEPESDELTTSSMFGTSPTWVDLYGRENGIKDFCSVLNEGTKSIGCYVNLNGDFRRVLTDTITNDLGYQDSRIFVKGEDTKDGKVTVGFCRIIGNDGSYRLRCNYYTAVKNLYLGATFYPVSVKETGVLDPGYDGNTVIAGMNSRSDNRWWVDLMNDGNYSYCRVVYYYNKVRIACRRFYGLDDGFSNGDIMSDPIDAGITRTRGWVKDFEGNVAYCRILNPSSSVFSVFTGNVHCLPFDKKTQQFKHDVELPISFLKTQANRYVETFRWVDDVFDNKTLGKSQSAICYIEEQAGVPWYMCSQLNGSGVISFNPVLAGYDDTKGFMRTPHGSGIKTWCGLIDEGLNRINCGTFEVTPSGEFKRVTGVSNDLRVDSGARDIFNGNREWMNYVSPDQDEQNILFCRKVNSNDMRCTKIGYN